MRLATVGKQHESKQGESLLDKSWLSDLQTVHDQYKYKYTEQTLW